MAGSHGRKDSYLRGEDTRETPFNPNAREEQPDHRSRISQKQRDESRAEAPTPEHAGEMTPRGSEMANDHGLER